LRYRCHYASTIHYMFWPHELHGQCTWHVADPKANADGASEFFCHLCRFEVFYRTGSIIYGGGQVHATVDEFALFSLIERDRYALVTCTKQSLNDVFLRPFSSQQRGPSCFILSSGRTVRQPIRQRS
jgi:hypothetical protein